MLHTYAVFLFTGLQYPCPLPLPKYLSLLFSTQHTHTYTHKMHLLKISSERLINGTLVASGPRQQLAMLKAVQTLDTYMTGIVNTSLPKMTKGCDHFAKAECAWTLQGLLSTYHQQCACIRFFLVTGSKWMLEIQTFPLKC